MYGAKSKYVRKYARKGRKGKVSGLLKRPSTAITTLAKAVKSLQVANKKKTVSLNYSQSFNTGVTGDCQIFKLANLNAWTPIFGTASDDATANSAIWKSFGIDMYLTLENTVNEPDTTQFTIFLVSLKDDAQTNTFDPSTGALSMAPNFHYSINGGLVLLNKKAFNIHGVKRRVLTNHGTSLANPSAQTQGGTDMRVYMKCRVNKRITAPFGNWKDLACPADPSKNYFLLVFNNNSGLDLQNPVCQLNVVHSVEQLA